MQNQTLDGMSNVQSEGNKGNMHLFGFTEQAQAASSVATMEQPAQTEQHQEQGYEIMPNGLPNYYSRKRGAPKDDNQPEIVAVRKTEAGIISHYKLSNGMVLNKAQAVEYAKTKGIKGVNVGRTRGEDHTEMLRANPTNDPTKALYNLPTF